MVVHAFGVVLLFLRFHFAEKQFFNFGKFFATTFKSVPKSSIDTREDICTILLDTMSELNNIYHGHKVVAMPSSPFDGLSYLEKKGDDGSISSYHSRYRSRSNGRGASISRSRDIVQDVYDRMGVNYVRGRPSIDSILDQNRAPGDTKKGSGQDMQRSIPHMNTRQSEVGTASTKKPGSIVVDSTSGHQRSTHRGRLTRQWPPGPPGGVSNDNDDNGSSHSRTSQQSKKNSTIMVTESKERSNRMSMPTAFSSYGLRNVQTDQRDEEGKEIEIHAPDDERDGISVLSFKSNKSLVRDRIGAYATSAKSTTGSRANVRHSYSGSSIKRSYPPKVNLYDSIGNNDEGKGERADVSVDGSNVIDQSSCIGGTRNLQSSTNSVSRSVADAYLTSISKPSNQGSSPRAVSKNIAVVEISTNDFHGNDNASEAASSVSGEDFLPSSPTKKCGSKSHVGKTIGGDSDFSKASIEKFIEDRVQSQISILTRKFEAEIRRVENRIDQECKVRIEELEKRN